MHSPTEFTKIYAQAVKQKKVDDFVQLYSEDICQFDMWDDFSLAGQETCRQIATEWFSSLGSEYVEVTFSNVQIVESGDLALLSGFVRFAGHAADGTRLRFLDERITVSMRKVESGLWKVFHQHTSAPVDSKSLAAKLIRQ